MLGEGMILVAGDCARRRSPGRRRDVGGADPPGARVLRVAGSGEDIACELGAQGDLRDRTCLAQVALRGCGAFVEVSRARWMLGEPGGSPAAPLPFNKVFDYVDRVHRDAHRTTALWVWLTRSPSSG